MIRMKKLTACEAENLRTELRLAEILLVFMTDLEEKSVLYNFREHEVQNEHLFCIYSHIHSHMKKLSEKINNIFGDKYTSNAEEESVK